MPITKDQLISHREYATLRQKFIREVIAEKKLRRIAISDRMSGLFENRLTVWFQIQEMIHAEQIEKDAYIDEMLEVYNELMPFDNELSMTLFIEIPDQEKLRAFNKTVVGIEEHVHLVFDGHTVTSYEPGDEEESGKDYTQSVHYLHFPFQPEQKAAFLAAGPSSAVKLLVDHPNYRSEATLSSDTVAELQKQLQAQ